MIASPGPATPDMGQTSVSTLSPQPSSGESRGARDALPLGVHGAAGTGQGFPGASGRACTRRGPREKPERSRSPKLFVVAKWTVLREPAALHLKGAGSLFRRAGPGSGAAGKRCGARELREAPLAPAPARKKSES